MKNEEKWGVIKISNDSYIDGNGTSHIFYDWCGHHHRTPEAAEKCLEKMEKKGTFSGKYYPEVVKLKNMNTDKMGLLKPDMFWA